MVLARCFWCFVWCTVTAGCLQLCCAQSWHKSIIYVSPRAHQGRWPHPQAHPQVPWVSGPTRWWRPTICQPLNTLGGNPVSLPHLLGPHAFVTKRKL